MPTGPPSGPVLGAGIRAQKAGLALFVALPLVVLIFALAIAHQYGLSATEYGRLLVESARTAPLTVPHD